MTEDERAIRRVVATWLDASKHGDIETVMSLMTDDVVFLVPGQKPFGKAAFAAASKSMADMKIDGPATSRNPGSQRLGVSADASSHDGYAAGRRTDAATR